MPAEESDDKNSENVDSTTIVDFSTAKPLQRGKKFVESDHLRNVLVSLTDRKKFFCIKCNVKASYKKNEYDVRVMVNPENGKVIIGECNCKASSLGRCSHVTALLYGLLNYRIASEKNEPACTSKLCVWNQGRKIKKPLRIEERQYCNKVSPIQKNFAQPSKYVE